MPNPKARKRPPDKKPTSGTVSKKKSTTAKILIGVFVVLAIGRLAMRLTKSSSRSNHRASSQSSTEYRERPTNENPTIEVSLSTDTTMFVVKSIVSSPPQDLDLMIVSSNAVRFINNEFVIYTQDTLDYQVTIENAAGYVYKKVTTGIHRNHDFRWIVTEGDKFFPEQMR